MQGGTHRLIVADGVNLCAKHYSRESEEEDGFETEEDQEQHRHPWREVTALWIQRKEDRPGDWNVKYIKHINKQSL